MSCPEAGFTDQAWAVASASRVWQERRRRTLVNAAMASSSPMMRVVLASSKEPSLRAARLASQTEAWNLLVSDAAE